MTVRSRVILLVGLLLIVTTLGGAYVAGRLGTPALPPIVYDDLDPEVIVAVKEARAEVAARPRSAAAWGRLGMVLYANTLFEDSIPVFAQAEKLDPRDARWPYLGGLALVLQSPDEGVAALKRAASLPPPNLTIRLRLAEEYVKQDRFEEADELLRDVLAENPQFPWALLGQAQILMQRGQWQEAVAPLEQAAADPTAQRAARNALADAYTRLGKTAEAEAERKRAQSVPPDRPWQDAIVAEAEVFHTGVNFHITQATNLLKAGQLEQAGQVITAVVRDHPDRPDAHLAMAQVLITANVVDEAMKHLRLAIDLNPKLVEAHFLLAGAQMVKEQYSAAAESYRRTLELKPTYGVAHYNLGECRLKQGDRAGARQAFRDALRCRPDLVVAHLGLGTLLLDDGQLDEAIIHLEEAARLNPQSERARGLLEQARKKKG
jgi:tetratricopeptide (TPR) repeat protein